MTNISIRNIRDRDVSAESRFIRFFAASEDASYTASANNSALSHGDTQFQICFAPMPSLCEIASDLLGIWIEDYEEYGGCEWKLINTDTKEIYGEGSYIYEDYAPSGSYQMYYSSLELMITEVVQNTTKDISVFIGGYGGALVFINNTGDPISLRLSIKNVYNFPDIDYDNPPETLPEGYEDFYPGYPMLREYDFYDNITNPSFSITYENEAENIPVLTKVIGDFCLKPYNYCNEEPVEIRMVDKGIDISNKDVIICYNRYGYDEYYHMFTGLTPDDTPSQDPDYTSYITSSLTDSFLGLLNTYYTDDYVYEGTSPCLDTGFVPATTITFTNSYASNPVSFNYSEDDGITWKKITGYPTSSFNYSAADSILKAIKIGMEDDGYTVTNTADSVSVSKPGIKSLLIATTGPGYYFYVNGIYWDYHSGSRYVDGRYRDARTIYPITCDNGYKDPMRNIEKVYYTYAPDGFSPHMPFYNSKTYYIKKATDLEEGQVDFLSTFTNYDQIAITICDGDGGGYH